MQQADTALLIIDIINDFQFNHGREMAKKTGTFLPKLLALKNSARSRQIPIIYINDHYNLWTADLDKIAQACLNDLSRPIIEAILPSTDDYFLIKPKHSAFYGTALNTLLHQLSVKRVLLTGIAGNICVLFTANDAYMREFRITAVEDCIASNMDEDNTYALRMMKNVLKAEVLPAHQIFS